METNNQLDQLIKEEVLRERVRKIIDEPKSSWLGSLSRHPLTSVIVGFLFTGILAGVFNDWQNTNNKKAEERTQKYEKKLEANRLKRIEGLRAVRNYSELVNARLATARMLGSALVRNASLSELETYKTRYDDAQFKWSVQRFNTYMTVNEMSLALNTRIGPYEETIRNNSIELDKYLLKGFDRRKSGISWKADSAYIGNLTINIRKASDVMLSIIWLETRPEITGTNTPKPTK